MLKANDISIFNNNCKIEKIKSVLSDHFNQMMKGEINDSSRMFINILRIYKGGDKYSADYNKALEYILAKISTSIKSNFLNLRLMLEYFSDLKISKKK